jgi:protein-tyrosine kinase
MSLFFEALERAERDRQLRAGSDGALSPPAEEKAEASTSTLPAHRPEPAAAAAASRVEAGRTATSPLAGPLSAAPIPAASSAERSAPVATSSEWPSPQAEPRASDRARHKAGKNRTKPTTARDGAPVPIADLGPNSVATEAYRALRVNIEFMREGRTCQNVAITSPSRGEGKSTTAANLAVVSAHAGWRVCLVEADFRRPVLHTTFGLVNRGGLAKALTEEVPLSAVAVATAFPRLSVVVAGDQDPGQTDLFSSHRIHQVRVDIESHYDLVLWDTPPLMLVADAINVVAHCDGVILVVRSGAIPYSVLRRASRQIVQVKGKLLGVLLNGVDLRRIDEEVYRYYHEHHKSDDMQQ